EFFEELASLWGILVEVDAVTKAKRSLSFARMVILSSSPKFVNANIKVKIDDYVFALSIIEECQLVAASMDHFSRSNNSTGMGFGDFPMDAQHSSQASFMAVPWAVRTIVEIPGGCPEALSGRGQCVELNKTFLSAAYSPVPHLDLDPRASAMLPHAWPGERLARFLGSAIGLPSGHTQPRGGHAGTDCTPGCGQVLGGLVSPTSPQVAYDNASTQMVRDNLIRGGAHFPLQLGLNEPEGEREINL
ncbi:hypothetical protein Ancab_013192, partial [Ancistrocladus abbreviatus]